MCIHTHSLLHYRSFRSPHIIWVTVTIYTGGEGGGAGPTRGRRVCVNSYWIRNRSLCQFELCDDTRTRTRSRVCVCASVCLSVCLQHFVTFKCNLCNSRRSTQRAERASRANRLYSHSLLHATVQFTGSLLEHAASYA